MVTWWCVAREMLFAIMFFSGLPTVLPYFIFLSYNPGSILRNILWFTKVFPRKILGRRMGSSFISCLRMKIWVTTQGELQETRGPKKMKLSHRPWWICYFVFILVYPPSNLGDDWFQWSSTTLNLIKIQCPRKRIVILFLFWSIHLLI